MTIAIVTSRTFLLCESINSIMMDSDWQQRGRNVVRQYNIDIRYNPIPRNNNSGRGSDEHSVSIQVVGEKAALKLFKELVQQIREQCPDQAYLDKMVDNILNGSIGDIYDDPDTKPVRGVRKKKR